jgi:hypothetical protein
MPGGALPVGKTLFGIVGANRDAVGMDAAAGSAIDLSEAMGAESVGGILAEAAVVVEDSFQIVTPKTTRITKASSTIRCVLYLLNWCDLAGFLIFGIKLPFERQTTEMVIILTRKR